MAKIGRRLKSSVDIYDFVLYGIVYIIIIFTVFVISVSVLFAIKKSNSNIIVSLHKVVDKEVESGSMYSTHVNVSDILVPTIHKNSNKYFIEIDSEGSSKISTSKEQYNIINIGDTVDVTYYYYKDKLVDIDLNNIQDNLIR